MKGSIGCFTDPAEKSKQTTFCDFEEIIKIWFSWSWFFFIRTVLESNSGVFSAQPSDNFAFFVLFRQAGQMKWCRGNVWNCFYDEDRPWQANSISVLHSPVYLE